MRVFFIVNCPVVVKFSSPGTSEYFCFSKYFLAITVIIRNGIYFQRGKGNRNHYSLRIVITCVMKVSYLLVPEYLFALTNENQSAVLQKIIQKIRNNLSGSPY